jgi:hypothetical protein
MLIDRACPAGGWNAGNSVVFGVALDPQPDFTAMALLALRDSIYAGEPLIARSLDYLAKRFDASPAPYSIAWASIAFAAYDHPLTDYLRTRLEAAAILKLDELPCRTLALAALALETPSFKFREPLQ